MQHDEQPACLLQSPSSSSNLTNLPVSHRPEHALASNDTQLVFVYESGRVDTRPVKEDTNIGLKQASQTLLPRSSLNTGDIRRTPDLGEIAGLVSPTTTQFDYNDEDGDGASIDANVEGKEEEQGEVSPRSRSGRMHFRDC